MDKIVDVRFERVEKALATLVESITKYSPQASQALELANADNELGKGLKDRLSLPLPLRSNLSATVLLKTFPSHSGNSPE